MSLDNDIKEAFRKHEGDARASETAWAGIEGRIRRTQRVRTAFISGVMIVLIGGAVVLVPRIGTGKKSEGFTNPSVTPSDTTSPESTPTKNPSAEPTIVPPPPAPAIPAGWQRRVGVQSAFQLAIPADWKGGWFEGTWDFEPKSLPSASQGGDTFTVTVTVQPGNYETPKEAKTVSINGNSARTWQPNATETDYAIEWYFCAEYGPCSSNFSYHTLIARLRAATPTLWSTYESFGRRIVDTLWVYDGSIPAHGAFRSPADNEFNKSLTRFMDARVEGIGAEDLMCCSIANEFAQNGELYQVRGDPIIRWTVSDETAVPGGVRYRVQWEYGTNSEGEEAEITVAYRDTSNKSVPPIPQKIGPISHWIA